MGEVAWLTEEQAMEHVDRARVTLREWRRNGEVSASVQGPRRIMYYRPSLDECAELQRKRYLERPLPGRPRG